MSRQSKKRRKRKVAKQIRDSRTAKPKLSKESRELRRRQQAILIEARRAERERLIAEQLARKQQEERKLAEARVRRAEAKRSPRSSQTLAVPSVTVNGEGTVMRLKAATVISRRGVHIKTYDSPMVQVKFLGDGKRAVVILDPNQPPRLLDLETGQDQPIDPELPKDATVLIQSMGG